jgi:hypothetical protein
MQLIFELAHGQKAAVNASEWEKANLESGEFANIFPRVIMTLKKLMTLLKNYDRDACTFENDLKI